MLQEEQVLGQWFKLEEEFAQFLYSEIKTGQITLAGRTLKFKYFTFGQRPAQGYRLVFGLHGGGGCPTPENDSQYQNHMHLYDDKIPTGTIWFVPRSCQQAPDMWWKDYLPEFFQVIIRGFVLKYIVNPNQVFMTGYSAGGDGIYHLAPMMADYWAGAAMMAGHPNQVELYNVRNTCFSIQVGGQDAAYNRNALARKYIEKLVNLQWQYGGFTPHYCRVFQECPHWLSKKDANIFDQFLNESRNPYPDCILFKQHPRTKKKYLYYVQVDPQQHKELLVVRKQGNCFFIEGSMPVMIYVNHLMVDFTKEIVISHNGQIRIRSHPLRKHEIVKRTVRERQDPFYIFEDCFVSIPNQQKAQIVRPPPPMQFKQSQDCSLW